MAKILIVDDDEVLLESLQRWLIKEHHKVDSATDGLEALEYLKSYTYDVIVLDWQLPNLEGIDVCRKFRESGGKSFIIMLTGQSESQHKLMGLNTGADDYMTKPFDTRELIARINACLRRPSEFHGEVLQAGPLVCDVKARRVKLDSAELKLTPQEYTVLEFFMRHPDEIYSCEALMQRAWTSEDEIALDAIYTCIARLRKKLKMTDGKELIQNIYGVGYKFSPTN